MKFYCLLTFAVLFFLFAKQIYSQNSVKFTYDDVGNRTRREITFKKSQTMITDSSLVIQPEIDWLDKVRISIYPNPTDGQLRTEFSGIEESLLKEIFIYDSRGKRIQQKKLMSNSSIIDISTYPDGEYLMKIVVYEKVSTWKIIKE